LSEHVTTKDESDNLKVVIMENYGSYSTNYLLDTQNYYNLVEMFIYRVAHEISYH